MNSTSYLNVINSICIWGFPSPHHMPIFDTIVVLLKVDWHWLQITIDTIFWSKSRFSINYCNVQWTFIILPSSVSSKPEKFKFKVAAQPVNCGHKRKKSALWWGFCFCFWTHSPFPFSIECNAYKTSNRQDNRSTWRRTFSTYISSKVQWNSETHCSEDIIFHVSTIKCSNLKS